MIACYAPGGGLGHVARTGAVARALGFADGYALITSAPAGTAARLAPTARVIQIPRSLAGRSGALRRWLVDCLGELDARSMLVDAFPGGLFGELDASLNDLGIRLEHVARLLRWGEYRSRVRGQLPRYARAWAVEPLHADHRAALEEVSGHIAALELPSLAAQRRDRPALAGEWLVVHSGPAHEVLELIDYARGIAAIEHAAPRLTVVTEADLPDRTGFTRADHADLARHCDGAGRIFTAAGFNTLRELRRWRSRVSCVPFPRAFDDQFERARRWRAGQV